MELQRKPHIGASDKPGIDKYKCAYPTGEKRIFGYGYTPIEAFIDWGRKMRLAAEAERIPTPDDALAVAPRPL